MEVAILIVHVLLAVALIGFIMIQQGKGADAGASFGGGGAS
ncbi:MAG: preprotein translocase subunit SecG, partial [Oceanospirillaceae bacterium]|nr:preprotein translocase subunit SecG [Oceanospirillaceae bacterium]